MATTRDDFSTYEPGSDPALGDNWRLAASDVATHDTALASAPTVEDDGEPYLAPGICLLADGDLVPAGQITRVSALVDLDAAESIVRLVLPYNELSAADPPPTQYLVAQARRRLGGDIELSIYLTDPNLYTMGDDPAAHQLVALAKPGTSGSERALFSVEAGPRFLRAWWEPGRTRFSRSAPAIGAMIPEIDHLTWGVLSQGGRVRSVEVDTDPHRADDDDRYRLEADTDDPDGLVTDPMDTSRAVLVEYTVTGHARRQRAGVLLTAGGPAAGLLADHFFRRLDESQTIILIPDSQTSLVTVATEQEGVAGPANDAKYVFADQDPSGGDGGIGSGRSELSSGGELCVDLPHTTLESTIEIDHLDEVSVTGGQEAYLEISSRQRRTWGIKAKLRRTTGVRRLERIVAASGGLRPIWTLPPLEPGPVRTMTSSVQHEIVGTNRQDVSYELLEL